MAHVFQNKKGTMGSQRKGRRQHCVTCLDLGIEPDHFCLDHLYSEYIQVSMIRKPDICSLHTFSLLSIV